MNISFAPERWGQVRETYRGWWSRTLERPVVNLTLTGAPSGLPKPEGYRQRALWQYPPGTPVERVVEDDLYTLATQVYAADSFPMLLPDYGAGVNAAFCGCKAEVREETVWFVPPSADISVEELRLAHDPASPAYAMLREYYRLASARLEGRAVLGMTHLNNGIDIVARFVEGVEMGLALYDHPEEVKRLIGENHRLFLRYLEELTACMGGDAPGYSCWGSLYAEKPWFGAQSDFAAMIGPEAFAEFILPELLLCWEAFPEANYYHLDGPGQLCHLDRILDCPALRCVQWVPGDGAAPPADWPEVYRKIAAAGKNIWYMGGLEELERIAEVTGTTRGLYWQGELPWAEADRAEALCRRLGTPLNLS